MTQNTDTTAPAATEIPNIISSTTGRVHKGKMVKSMWHQNPIAAPACMSRGQIDRMRGAFKTDQAVTCDKPKCQD